MRAGSGSAEEEIEGGRGGRGKVEKSESINSRNIEEVIPESNKKTVLSKIHFALLLTALVHCGRETDPTLTSRLVCCVA